MENKTLNSTNNIIIDENIKNNIKKKHDLEIKLYNLNKEIYDCELRGQAKIENIKKNSAIEIKKIKKTQSIIFAKKILCLSDDLEELIKIDDVKNNHIIQGVDLILKTLLNVFCKIKITVENKKNIMFTPHLHEVIQTQESKDIPSNYIISIIKPGYVLHNTVLRKSKVIVSL